MSYIQQLENLIVLLEAAYELTPALREAAYNESYIIRDHISLNNEAAELQEKILSLLADAQEAADAHLQRTH